MPASNIRDAQEALNERLKYADKVNPGVLPRNIRYTQRFVGTRDVEIGRTMGGEVVREPRDIFELVATDDVGNPLPIAPEPFWSIITDAFLRVTCACEKDKYLVPSPPPRKESSTAH